MLKRIFFSLLAGTMVILAACQPEAEVLPTLAPTLVQETVTEEPTEPPATLVTATVPPERATLPPTWTPPASAPTETFVPASVAPLPTVPPPPSPLAVCATFGVDVALNVSPFFVLGDNPQVYWTPVEGAVSYYLRLIDESAEELFADYLVETTFTFQADFFEKDKRYAWEVYPIDNLGQQMCIAIGAELFPE